MKKRIGPLVREEMVLLLNGHRMEAISHYSKRTGHSLIDTRIAILNWLQSKGSSRA
jgi:hypothetical protein